MATSVQYTQLDPNKATRKAFTDQLTNVPIPSNASEDWRGLALKLQSLLRKLADHQAMQPNIQQTFMTPAASKNRVYFMWDFIGRTLGMLYKLPPDSDSKDKQSREIWFDVAGRGAMAGGLIIDDKPGMLNQMIESTNPTEKGRHPEFGDDILSEARALFKFQYLGKAT